MIVGHNRSLAEALSNMLLDVIAEASGFAMEGYLQGDLGNKELECFFHAARRHVV